MEDNCNCVEHFCCGYEAGLKAAENKQPVTFDIDRNAIASIYNDELDCVFEGDYEVNILYPKDLNVMHETQDWVFMLSTMTEKCKTNITAVHFIPSERTDIALQLIED